jgi:hypothetical protein
MLMRRFSVLLIALGGLCYAVPAHGQLLETMARDFKRNNCWPQPFVAPDRQAVRSPFVIMVHNGWRRQNILGEYHFRPDNGELTEAGKLKVQWILTQAPKQHRIIFVHQAQTADQTAARIDAVEQLAVQLAPTGELPQVVETHLNEAGWSADKIDRVSRDFYEKTAPKPRLPDAQSSGSGQ